MLINTPLLHTHACKLKVLLLTNINYVLLFEMGSDGLHAKC